jgi:hypothetical protein
MRLLDPGARWRLTFPITAYESSSASSKLGDRDPPDFIDCAKVLPPPPGGGNFFCLFHPHTIARSERSEGSFSLRHKHETESRSPGLRHPMREDASRKITADPGRSSGVDAASERMPAFSGASQHNAAKPVMRDVGSEARPVWARVRGEPTLDRRAFGAVRDSARRPRRHPEFIVPTE